MSELTITEALAELKTLGKRIDKKREYVNQVLFRQDGFKDPLEKDGGSIEVIRRERQAIDDLIKRHVSIRVAIQKKNLETPITVGQTTRTIAEWLTWRKEISSGEQSFISKMRLSIAGARTQAHQKGMNVILPGETAQKPADILINVDESELAKDIKFKMGFTPRVFLYREAQPHWAYEITQRLNKNLGLIEEESLVTA